MELLEEFFIEKIEEIKKELYPYLIDVLGEENADIIKERLMDTKIYIHHDSVAKQNLQSMKRNGNTYKIKDLDRFNEIMNKLLEEYDIIENINSDQSIFQELCEEYFPTYKRIYFPLKFILSVDALINTKKSKDPVKNRSRERKIVEYYKLLGVDLGDSLEAYLNSEEAKKVTIGRAKAKEFLAKYKLLNDKYLKIFSNFSDNYRKITESLLVIPSFNEMLYAGVINSSLESKPLSFMTFFIRANILQPSPLYSSSFTLR